MRGEKIKLGGKNLNWGSTTVSSENHEHATKCYAECVFQFLSALKTFIFILHSKCLVGRI